ncbi:unnamed protein product [Cuscuta epithymum]|uniref:Pectinesterase inhibitor domain-containing protein n=1 Tax=Cuscuta epithymum TaxID=186058 RepID=A0AAV0E4F0_9ASTE|nr:unnamed protein product [Cuscuta epithymum]CAH9128956.1 unnamed protein product [Cuscuta epithymum]
MKTSSALIMIFLCSVIQPPLPAAAVLHSSSSSTPPSAAAAKSFIYDTCNSANNKTTSTCYGWLSAHAGDLEKLKVYKLVKLAMNLTLAEAKFVVKSIKDSAEKGLGDCLETMGDCVDSVKMSLSQVKHLTPNRSEVLHLQISNLQTWMSAALTDEDTCEDEIGDVSDTGLKSLVADGIRNVSGHISITLALINLFAHKCGF